MRALVCSLLIAFSACKSAPAPHEVTPALQKVVAGKPLPNVEPAIWTDVQTFYTQRQHAPAWVDHRRPTDKAAKVIALLNTARQHGYDPADYAAPALLEVSQAVEQIDKQSPERLDRLAEFDARMTAGLLAFGRDIAIGRQHGAANWKARRTAPDVVAAVSKAADDPDAFVGLLRPPHVEYARLQKALDDLNGQKEKGGWVKVPSAKAVNELRQRLLMSGHLKGSGIGDQGSGDLQAAVKSFQELHSLPATGIVDDKTLAAICLLYTSDAADEL